MRPLRHFVIETTAVLMIMKVLYAISTLDVCICIDVLMRMSVRCPTKAGQPRSRKTRNVPICRPGSAGLLSPASAGSCGYFNGDNASTTDPSAVTVPAIMRAAAADGNFDYAGSCGRYEIHCQVGS